MCKKHLPITSYILLGTLLFTLFLQACGGAEAPNPTLAAINLAIKATATAEAAESESENTLATAQAKATANSEAVAATSTAQMAGRDADTLATATVIAPIVAELPQYGLGASSGHAGWVHNPLTLEITGFQDYTYGNDYMNVIAADFVLASDITWDTQYGGSGCGFMFRSDGEKEKSNQYMIIITRFANGRAAFFALANGEFANLQDFYPKELDRSFDWRNGTTNRLTIVARGNLIDVYTNGVKIGTIDTLKPPKKPTRPAKPTPPPDQSDNTKVKEYENQIKDYQKIIQENEANYQTATMNFDTLPTDFKEGFLAMVALSQSGRTVCKFDNTWLWLLEP